MKSVDDVKRASRLLVSRAPELQSSLAEDVVRTRSLLEGHFRLQSGKHSGHFLRFAGLGYDHAVVTRLARLLLDRSSFATEPRPKVLVPESAAILLGRAIAMELRAPLVVAAVDGERRPTRILRMGRIEPGEPVIVVTDIITTGSSLSALLGAAGTRPIGVLAFAALSADPLLCLDETRPDVRTDWLAQATWTPRDVDRCPQCEAGEPQIPATEFN